MDLLNRQVRITNHFLFANINEYNGTWKLVNDNGIVSSGILSSTMVDIQPLSSKTITIDYGNPFEEAGAEYWLNIRFALKQSTLWAPGGHEAAIAQFKVAFATSTLPMVDTSSIPAPSVTEQSSTITINDSDFEVIFDKSGGSISSYIYNGVKLLNAGHIPNFWSAPLDSDYVNNMLIRCATW